MSEKEEDKKENWHFFQTKKKHPDFKGYPDTRGLCDECGLTWLAGKHLSGG